MNMAKLFKHKLSRATVALLIIFSMGVAFDYRGNVVSAINIKNQATLPPYFFVVCRRDNETLKLVAIEEFSAKFTRDKLFNDSGYAKKVFEHYWPSFLICSVESLKDCCPVLHTSDQTEKTIVSGPAFQYDEKISYDLRVDNPNVSVQSAYQMRLVLRRGNRPEVFLYRFEEGTLRPIGYMEVSKRHAMLGMILGTFIATPVYFIGGRFVRGAEIEGRGNISERSSL